jgi:hypothetical protein
MSNPNRMDRINGILRVDKADLLAFMGLVMLGVGVGLMSVAWALVVVGGLLFGISVISAVMRAK